MNYDQFKNISCYEEFDIQCTLAGISKIKVLKEIGHEIDDYYFFISNDGIFNWFDLEGNHIEYPHVLKMLKCAHIPNNITKCIVPDSVIDIEKMAFYKCTSLTSINIPDSVTNINEYAFWHCESLKEITIPDNVINIGRRAFSYCKSLTSISIPDNVINIGRRAFSYCKSLTSISIPDSVINIGDGAFSYCKSLTSISIPDSVINIGDSAFYDCESLKEVIFKGKTLEEVKQMENYPFGIEDESKIKCEGSIWKKIVLQLCNLLK